MEPEKEKQKQMQRCKDARMHRGIVLAKGLRN